MIPEKRFQIISQNLETIREKMDSSAVLSGRNVRDINLVVVTKTWSPDIISVVIENGISQLGENRIQEAAPKIEQLNSKYKNIIWHMIGHLQSNKAGQAVEKFNCIQSVDSVKIARRISNAAKEKKKTIDVLLEINISEEMSKFGLSTSEIIPAAEEIMILPYLNLLGLMTIGPLTPDKQKIRSSFKKMKGHFDDLVNRFPGTINVLSMGMSDDYEIAIEEGSTMVRLGRAIFGYRER
ncbi:MAG: YggS family pyridoxal phosphate-dependent enzyme [Candidatus Marinimicrobia bacterium]|nr:YggS family pyridoxal phosphate-dependent enzyme [Candidatus Neomarinimicrobiota bacterium]